MVNDFEKVHFCLNCSSMFKENEFEILKIKNYIFTLGFKKVKCPNCKKRGKFIELTYSWAKIISLLNKKGYKVVDCSIINRTKDKRYTYIAFDEPIMPNIKPKYMNYDSDWIFDDNILVKSNENLCVLKYEYYNENKFLFQFEKLTSYLLKWAKAIPVNT